MASLAHGVLKKANPGRRGPAAPLRWAAARKQQLCSLPPHYKRNEEATNTQQEDGKRYSLHSYQHCFDLNPAALYPRQKPYV